MAEGEQEVEPTIYDVPVGLAGQIWAETREGDHHSLMTVSKGLQAIFAPAVTSLLCTLQPDDAQQGSLGNMFPGLHPEVRPQELTIRRHNWQDLSAPSTGNSYAQSLQALAGSPHSSQLRHLCLIAVSQSKLTSVLSAAHPLVGADQLSAATTLMATLQIDFDEEAAHALEPVFRLSTFTALELRDCRILPEGVGHLAACQQLQKLVLCRVTLAPGAAAAFTALAGLPSLDTLVLRDVSAFGADDLHRSTFGMICSIGSGLSHLEYASNPAGGSANRPHPIFDILAAAQEGHLASLTHLDVMYDSPSVYVVTGDQLDFLPDCCPLLHHLKLDRVTPSSLHSLATLMAMPDLQELAVYEPCTVAMPVTCAWPADKARMCLRCHVVPASVIPNLPLQHISRLCCDSLNMECSADSTSTGEQENLRSMLGVLHSTGVSFHTAAISGADSSQFFPPSGLSALPGPDCCLQLGNPAEIALTNMTLDAHDVLAVSFTWGHTLESLSLACLLTDAAWGAINAVNFPNLTKLEVTYCWEAEPSGLDLCAHLTALCLDWPQSKHLDLFVIDNAQLASACQAALQGRGRTNVRITGEPAPWQAA